VDNLREAAAARVEARPDLAVDAGVFGHGDDSGNARVGMKRERRADHPRGLRQEPAPDVEAGFDDFAGVDDGTLVGDALAEPAADFAGERVPFGFGEKRAEARVAK